MEALLRPWRLLHSDSRLQFGAMFLLFLICYGIGQLVDFTPAIRINLDTLIRGVVAGLLLVCVSAIGEILPAALDPSRYDSRLQEEKDSRLYPTPYARVGHALLRAFGIETLLRGYIFAPLLLIHPALAYIINAVLGAATRLRSKKTMTLAITAAVEATFLGAVYAWIESLFLVVIARLTAELAFAALARRNVFRTAIDNLSRYMRTSHDFT